MIAGIDPVDGLRAMLGHDFIRHAFLAGTFIALAAGLVGYFVVLRNQVFSGDALGHVAFTGALASFAAGVDPLLGLYGSTVLGAVGIGALGQRASARGRDVVIGTVFAWILGLGVLFLSLYTTSRSSANGAVGVNVLFGSIYGISLRQAVIAAAVGGATSLALLVISRPLLFASIDSDVAAARGLPVRLLGLGFMALVGVTVAEAVQAVGALLILALMVTPAATAHRLSTRPYRALALSAALSLVVLWAGLTLSYAVQRVPPSFLVVALAFAIYLLVTALARLWAPRPAPRTRPGRAAASA
jgi:zinc/manganese transport system permease protein